MSDINFYKQANFHHEDVEHAFFPSRIDLLQDLRRQFRLIKLQHQQQNGTTKPNLCKSDIVHMQYLKKIKARSPQFNKTKHLKILYVSFG